MREHIGGLAHLVSGIGGVHVREHVGIAKTRVLHDALIQLAHFAAHKHM